MRILLDLDEVLADFVGGARLLWKVAEDELLAYWPPGEWDLVAPLSKALGRDTIMSNTEFWNKIHEHEEAFWINLEPLPWMDKVLDLVQSVATEGEWYVVTAPSLRPSSYLGKAAWLQLWLGKNFDDIVVTRHKHLLANPDTLLIDDRESTVQKFIAKGGRGIVFPRHHNSLYPKAGNPVAYLEHALTWRKISDAS